MLFRLSVWSRSSFNATSHRRTSRLRHSNRQGVPAQGIGNYPALFAAGSVAIAAQAFCATGHASEGEYC